MKKRVFSLLLTLCLLCGLLVLPAEAASAKDVYNYLASIAKEGYYNSSGAYYGHDVALLDEQTQTTYGVFYYEQSKNVEVALYNDAFEVTLTLPSAMKLPYTAYMMVYDSKQTTGKVSVAASYNGGSFSSFSSFSGDSSLKADMLSSLNKLLPAVVEYTRFLLYLKGYTLKDLGLSSYNKCLACHCYGEGTVTKQPTCGADGARVYRCAVCGNTETEVLPATGNHSWDDGTVTKQPTCVSWGERTYRCKVCGAAKSSSDVPPNGAHRWDAGTVTKEPSCTEPGLTFYFCTLCSSSKEEPIPALGHTWAPSEALEQGESLHESTERYVCARCGESKEARLCAGEIFTDMPEDGNYAHEPIDWAYFHEPQITAGTSETAFSPKESCTRAQVVTFLWRTAGKPEPEAQEVPFTDVRESAYYYNAMLWAIEKGVTKGTSTTTFSPSKSCTRGEFVTLLWRTAGKPEPEAQENPFTDVRDAAFYHTPVLWAVSQGVTKGTSDTSFSPNSSCTRAQVVTFLWRAREIFETPEQPPEPEPPTCFTAESTEALIEWINTSEEGPSEEGGSLYPFLRAARELGSIPTAQSLSEDYVLHAVMVQSDRLQIEYFFRRGAEDAPEFEVLMELPDTEQDPQLTLDERMAQVNAELALQYEDWQYTKSTAVVDGTELELWYCDGGEYGIAGSEGIELAAPTAFFLWQGQLVMVRGIGGLYGTPWNNAYLALFRLASAALTE